MGNVSPKSSLGEVASAAVDYDYVSITFTCKLMERVLRARARDAFAKAGGLEGRASIIQTRSTQIG